MIQEIIAEIRSSKPYDVFYAHSLLALCGHIEAQAKELAELKDEASQQPAWGLDQVRQIIEERDSLKAELQQGYQDYDALRIQKDNEIRALKTEVEEWKAGSKAEADAGDEARRENTGLRAEVARLQKERDELEEVCCDNLTELVAVLQPYELSLGPNVKLVDVIAQLTRERDADKARLDWLEKQKSELHGGWDGEIDEPSYWRNPAAEWKISNSVKDGTGQFPTILKQLTLRAAIDAAMKEQP